MSRDDFDHIPVLTPEQYAAQLADIDEEIRRYRALVDAEPRGFSLPHDPRVIYTKDAGYDG